MLCSFDFSSLFVNFYRILVSFSRYRPPIVCLFVFHKVLLMAFVLAWVSLTVIMSPNDCTEERSSDRLNVDRRLLFAGHRVYPQS